MFIVKLIAYLSSIGCLLLLVVVYHYQRQAKRSTIRHRENPPKKWFGSQHYERLIKNPLCKRYLLMIRERVAITLDGDEQAIREQAVGIFLLSSLLTLVILCLCSLMIKEWHIWLVLLIIMLFILETLIDFFVNQVHYQLLHQQVIFIDYLRNKYFETSMIDEAFEEAGYLANVQGYHAIARQSKSIHQILSHPNGDHLLNTYYQAAPNKYLKLMAGLSFITLEYGDKQIKGSSLFSKSLSHLSSEIREEVLVKTKLNMGLKSMSLIALMPLLFIKPLKQWASSSFYPLKVFYQGPWGFVVEMVVLIAILVSYLALRKIQNTYDDQYAQSRAFIFEKWFENKFQALVAVITPSRFSKRYKKSMYRLTKGLFQGKLEWHYINKLTSALVVGTGVFALLVAYSLLGNNHLKTSPTTLSGFLAGELKGIELELAKERTLHDNRVLEQMTDKTTVEDLEKLVDSQLKMIKEERKAAVIRLTEKFQKLKAYRLKSYHFLFVYGTMWLAWSIPDLQVIARTKNLRKDIEHEVSKFQLVILMLMHVDHVTVDMVLDWLERFSTVLKEPLQEAIMNYDSGAYEALHHMKDRVKDDGFSKLVDHLISATEKLSINQAFDELESEKIYYHERRKTLNETMVTSKVTLGQTIGFIPIYALLVFYFMGPMLYASIQEMQMYMTKLQ